MIEFLSGRLHSKAVDRVVLNVGGVGYGLAITSRTYAELPREGETTELVVRTVVREESIALYGFADENERDVFDLLMTARGVGPRVALAALSALGVERLALAVVDRDLKTLTRIPGVGKKSAEQIAIDLEKKLTPVAQAARARLAVPGVPETAAGATGEAGGISRDGPVPAAVRDAIAALEALGCPPQTAQRAVTRAAEILGEKAPTTDLVREGLKHRR